MNTFDYIIIGAGASGLMLADAMGKDAFFANKKILLLDKAPKTVNNRTWCFWEKGSGDFDTLLYKSWDQIYFAGKDYKSNTAIAPYHYKMVRGIDFYTAYLKRVQSYSNITWIQDTVTSVKDMGTVVQVQTLTDIFSANKAFNSIFNYEELTNQHNYPVLQQHFLGWFVQTKDAVFDTNKATFMDFSIPQQGNTRFMYVLPFSSTEALVEYTLFSEQPLASEAYETALKKYMVEEFQCKDYRIVEKEKGNIPMSCYDFRKHNTANVLAIGVSGGWAKPSTGYTFLNTSKKTKALVNFLKTKQDLNHFATKSRFWYYDLLLLDILHHDNTKGRHIFETLFKHRSPQEIFKFLDEETNFGEDLHLIFGAPKMEFIQALFRRFIN